MEYLESFVANDVYTKYSFQSRQYVSSQGWTELEDGKAILCPGYLLRIPFRQEVRQKVVWLGLRQPLCTMNPHQSVRSILQRSEFQLSQKFRPRTSHQGVLQLRGVGSWRLSTRPSWGPIEANDFEDHCVWELYPSGTATVHKTCLNIYSKLVEDAEKFAFQIKHSTIFT